MKNILLVCAAGMSTSMLVKRMKEHAVAGNIEVNINALAISEAKDRIKKNEADIVLLGPQVRFQKSEIEEITQGKIPVAVIDMKHYGQMDGKTVLDNALILLASH
jgi:PTS system cellobiose-specific IIB component